MQAKSSIKKITNRGSRNNLFKHKISGQSSNCILKNVLNS